MLTVRVQSKVPTWANYQATYRERTAVSGVGEAAFIPVNPPQLPQGGQLMFLKGSHVVALVSGWAAGKPQLSDVQLTALGKLIASRL